MKAFFQSGHWFGTVPFQRENRELSPELLHPSSVSSSETCRRSSAKPWLKVTCREYSKAMSKVSLGLTVVRKSSIRAALLLSAYSPALEQTLCKRRASAEGDERASQWELFSLLAASYSFNVSVIFFNFVNGRSAASEPYFALCSHSLYFLSPPW